MKLTLRVFFILAFMASCMAQADDIADYVTNSRREVANTKKILNTTAGIFIDVNYRGTLIKPIDSSDRAPASVETDEGSSTDSDQ